MAAGIELDMEQLGNHIRSIASQVGADLFEGLYPKVKMVLVSQTKMCFHNSASPSGVPWKPLMHQRVRGSGTPAPLRDTGELMASLTANGPGSVDRREGIWLVFGSVHVRAWHNDGGTIVAVNAKFLCIPATKEALYAGSPRNFPGKLFFLWNDDSGKGVAIGIAVDYRQQQDQAEKYEERVKKIKSLMKQPPRLGGVRRVRARHKLSAISTWLKLAKRVGRGVGKATSDFWKRVKKALGFGKRKPKKIKKITTSTGTTKVSLPAKRASKKGERRVHYYLRKQVTVPARPFLDITIQTEEKLELIAWDHCATYIGDKLTGGS